MISKILKRKIVDVFETLSYYDRADTIREGIRVLVDLKIMKGN
jgi:hypothetical protein